MHFIDFSLDRVLLDLIQDGARISTLEFLTGLSRTKLYYVWHSLQRYRSPPTGRLPSEQSFLRTKKRHQQASILALILSRMPSDMDRLTRVHMGYRLYRHAIEPERLLYGVDYAAFLLKKLEDGQAHLVPCPDCGGQVLIFHATRCCFCHADTTLNHFVPSSGRSPDPVQAGQRVSSMDTFNYSLSNVT